MSVIQPVDDGQDDEREAINKAKNFEFVSEILGLYSEHSGKSTEAIIEETLVEKASFLAPHIYAIEVLVAMNSFMSSVERLSKLGVSTNINALCDSVSRFKHEVSTIAPWLIKDAGGTLEAFSAVGDYPPSGDYCGDESTAGESDEDTPVNFCGGELVKDKKQPDPVCPESVRRVHEFIQKLRAIRGASEE